VILEGKAAIITGGGTGVGAETTRVFVREGARVTIVGRRMDKLAETVESAGGSNKVLALAGDIADAGFVDEVVARTHAAFGCVDVVVNNAGLHAEPSRTHEIDIDAFDRMISVNLRGPFLLTRAALPWLLERGGGAIVNIASVAGIVGLRYAASYSASKGGLVQLTRAVALEYANQGIRVNCLCPGGISPTESRFHMTEHQLDLLREAYLGNPSGTRATTAEVAETILFLVGPHSGHMTGAVIAADGGYTAQ